ncbi:hypothetical protein LTR36_001685 [Oleoguttula mirabilis]|uniref:Uncharacterized protein n=1 Tax=Oleoguttula mirabilis TaxID=1507867 RepID=A0AAV9JNL6_9PEZI|nr:hypothetical protein LTR36_001685 [Oleoguttula mirabilis]
MPAGFLLQYMQAKLKGKSEYLDLTLGYGGTYDLGTPTLEHIAFSGCDRGVGVFFMIDENRCFAANIDIRGNITEGDVSIELKARASTAIDSQIRTRLEKESRDASWGPRTARMRESLVVVGLGARSRATSMDGYARYAVCAAVQEWLAMDMDQRKEPVAYRGLVVKRSGKVKQRAEKSLSAWRWRAVGVQTARGAWRFMMCR